MTRDTYADKITDPANLRMRAASGQVDDVRPLVAFLYRLARDEITTGVLEPIIDRVAQPDDHDHTFQFTNGWLARWAQDTADRLQGRPAALYGGTETLYRVSDAVLDSAEIGVDLFPVQAVPEPS